MRIISSFHDYYDVGMKYGMDKEVVYIRKTEPIYKIEESKLDSKVYTFKYPMLLDRRYWGKHVFSICGKFYIGYWMYIPSYEPIAKGIERTAFCYTIDELEREAKTWFPTIKMLDHKPWRDPRTYREILAWEFSNQGKFLGHELHQKYKTPILFEGCLDFGKVEKPASLWKDINLKQLEFFRILKDPVILYQDIFMYISGIIGTPENKMAKINNEERVITHGFDLKYSFRKRPNEIQGRKRRKNKS